MDFLAANHVRIVRLCKSVKNAKAHRADIFAIAQLFCFKIIFQLEISKLSNCGISLNWSIIDEVATRNTTAYFLDHPVGHFSDALSTFSSQSIVPVLKKKQKSNPGQTTIIGCRGEARILRLGRGA